MTDKNRERTLDWLFERRESSRDQHHWLNYFIGAVASCHDDDPRQSLHAALVRAADIADLCAADKEAPKRSMTNAELADAIEAIESAPTRLCVSCKRQVPINDWDYGICGTCRELAGATDDSESFDD